METDQILQLLYNILPALIVGAIAFFFFRTHVKNEYARRKFLLQKEVQSTSVPLRFQAYERMSLFLERINPAKLLLRLSPVSDDKEQYAKLLTASIEQEFEHNLAQQIYITEECWNVIKTAKNATVKIIRDAADNDEFEKANDLRENILKNLVNKPSPSDTGLSFIKSEIVELF